MGIGLLAPMPAVQMKSALETCGAMGRVAFGTNKWKVFAKVKEQYGEGIPVLIYPTSSYGDPDKLCERGFANFRGTFVCTVEPLAGKHPNPDVRPATTVSGRWQDTNWKLFWEVRGLVRLLTSDRIAIPTMTAAGQERPFENVFVPRGPMLVKADFL